MNRFCGNIGLGSKTRNMVKLLWKNYDLRFMDIMFVLKSEMTVTPVILNFKTPKPKKMTTINTRTCKFLLTLALFSSTIIQANASSSPHIFINKQVLSTPSTAVVTAAIVNSSIILSWAADVELANGHFIVERSTDNKNFKTVALILDGFISENDQKSYKFKEKETVLNGCGKAYYRIMQVGGSAPVQYGNSILVEVPNAPMASR